MRAVKIQVTIMSIILYILDKSVRMVPSNHRRDMNNSVQYTNNYEDITKSRKSSAIRTSNYLPAYLNSYISYLLFCIEVIQYSLFDILGEILKFDS